MSVVKNTTQECFKILGYVSLENLTIKPPQKDAIFGKLRKKSSYRKNGQELINEWLFDELADLIGNKGYSFQHGKFKNNDSNFTSDQFLCGNVVFVDIDEHNYEVEDIIRMSAPFYPSIIYHTLSSGINKETNLHDPSIKRYRVMWLLGSTIEEDTYKKITTFFINRLNADSNCKDIARMLLGGKNLCYAKENIIDINKILLSNDYIDFFDARKNTSKNSRRTKRDSSRFLADNPNIYPSTNPYTFDSIIEQIKTLAIKNKPDFLTEITSFEWINSLPLNQILGQPVNVAFNCIMPNHIDSNPSAGILFNEKRQQVYYCNSCPSPNMKHAKSVLGTLEALTGMNVICLQKGILNELDIPYLTEHKQRGLATIKSNKALIDVAITDKKFSKLEKKGLFKAYILFLEYIKSHLPAIPIVSNDIEIFASYGHIAQFIRKEFTPTKTFQSVKKNIYDKTNILNSYGFIEKIDYDDLPKEWLSKTNEYQSKHKPYKKITYWRVPKLTIEDLIRSVEMIDLEKNCGYKMSDMSINKVAGLHGQDLAHKVYNQQSINHTTFKSYENKVMKVVQAIIHAQSYYTRKMVQDNCDLKIREVNNFLPSITKKLGYKEVTINNEIRGKYSISYSDLNKGSKLFIKNE
ncbi:hypothetical protein [Proteiniclasticum ruminis]|uniref:Uncharacterized protein n=1 Tax=Proteiniclasticum ruminis TaxID=398199 RepID=A0A1G8I5Z1_9CLOT|nr:hypothetical protein [Proteiniclasticum ruminis]SDI14171.1 hypothetical protein SAMN05421804_101777 [Proteiniclasticum ruminis]